MPITSLGNVKFELTDKASRGGSTFSIERTRKTLCGHIDDAIQGNENTICKVKDTGDIVQINLTVNNIRLCDYINIDAEQKKEGLIALKQAIMDGQLDQELTENAKKAAANRAANREKKKKK